MRLKIASKNAEGSDFLFPLQTPPPPIRQTPRPSHPRGLDFSPFQIRLAPFRVRFGVLGGVAVGSGRGASVREKNITSLGLGNWAFSGLIGAFPGPELWGLFGADWDQFLRTSQPQGKVRRSRNCAERALFGPIGGFAKPPFGFPRKFYFASSPEEFVNIFFVLAAEFCIEKWVGILLNFFWSPSPAKRSTKNPRKTRGKFGAKFGAKFGTKIRKNLRETFVLQLS